MANTAFNLLGCLQGTIDILAEHGRCQTIIAIVGNRNCFCIGREGFNRCNRPE